MTPEEDRQKQIDLDAANARLAALGLAPGTAPVPLQALVGLTKPPKKRRSDAGVPRKKAAPPAPVQQGALTLEQAKHIRALQVKLVDAYEQHRISSENLDGVSEEIDLYLQSLTIAAH